MKKLAEEDIFNQALSKLSSGFSAEEAVFEYSETKEKLLPLLKISADLLNLPKNPVPQPAMQKKFMLVPAKSKARFGWFSFPLLAGIGSTLVVLCLIGTGYAALQSLPGENLFKVKKSAENLQLKFASSPQAKITLQVEIAQKRLNEAEAVLNNPGSNKEQQQAVIKELISSTSKTIAAVDNIAKSNPASENKPLVNSLENINNKQQELLKEIKTDDALANSEGAGSAEENASKLAEIKKYFAVADSEQTLTDLNSGGTVKTTPAHSTNTQTTTATSTPVPEVKGASSTLEKIAGEKSDDPKVAPNPNTVTGSFIFEDPAPQFSP